MFSPSFNRLVKYLAPYLVLMFFFYLGDSMMSFSSPVVVSQSLTNKTSMGLIIGFSSLVGFCVDLLVSRFFSNRRFDFFANLMYKFVIFFPLSLLLFPHKVWVFLFAMGVWGVYYELSRFSHFNFINNYLDHHQHAEAWSLIGLVQNLAISIGPVLAGYFLAGELFRNIFLLAFSFFIISYLIFTLFNRKLKKHQRHLNAEHENVGEMSFSQELRLWRIMLKKVWPLYLLLIVVTLLDAAFWVAGPLLVDQVDNWYIKFLLPAYTLPALLESLYISKLSNRFSKKKLAFIGGIIGGLLVALSFLTVGTWWLLVYVFLAGAFIHVVITSIYAVFEDYVERLGYFKNDLIGLQSSAISLAYMLGPAGVGFLLDRVVYRLVIAIFALLLVVFSVVCLLIVPRKIRMPQKELNKAVEE